MIRTVIIEDDPMVAQINRRYLDKFAMIKVVAVLSRGKEALQYLRTHKADLAILDVYMPEITGIELLRHIRSENIPMDVIMVTAANDVRQVEELLRFGIVDYLVKPFEYERFRGAIEKYLLRKGLLDSNRTLNQNNIDQVVKMDRHSHHAGQGLEKGLQEKTLQTILSALSGDPTRYFSCEDISEHIGLSKVTVRRYLNHLAQDDQVSCIVDYETGGRPSMKYRYQTAHHGS